MAKKNLLSETQIRRFQSLANISALNEMGSYNKGRRRNGRGYVRDPKRRRNGRGDAL